MSEALELYGTEVPPEPSEHVELGDLSFTLQDGGLRHIKFRGSELIRAIAFVVRDRNWGTVPPRLSETSRSVLGDGFELNLLAEYRDGRADLSAELTIRADATGLSFAATSVAHGAFETARSGFAVLHPASVSGCPAKVLHSDGEVETSHFPELIEPWQPFMDIVSLTHTRDGFDVTCAFEGDTFEMEDQRQWGDASFKTYVRPLALPWPYLLADGEAFSQKVSLAWQENAAVGHNSDTQALGNAAFPETAILVTAEHARALAQKTADLEKVKPQRLLCHLDMTLGDVERQVASFANLQAALPGPKYDLELICKFDQSPSAELGSVRSMIDEAGFAPHSVMVCPSVDRQSTPPGSVWPECPPLADVHAASAEHFGDIARGGGMVTFFPELNRKRPPSEMLDFVAHGLCPIVHAADDLSVIEALEAIPHITKSARAIIGGRDYRIGPSTIAMRTNPYGSQTIPNPDNGRVCMADRDPRHFGKFGAAYVIGLATAVAPANIAVWTPAEFYGSRGLEGPIVAAIAALTQCAGQQVKRAEINDGVARLVVGGTLFEANLTDTKTEGLGPFEWRESHLADGGGKTL